MTEAQHLNTQPEAHASHLPKHIAFFLSSLDGGGAQRTFVNLACALSKQGYRIDLVLARLRGPLISEIPESIRIHTLGIQNPIVVLPSLLRLPPQTRKALVPILLTNRPKIVRSLPTLIHYLRAERPDALLTTLDRSNLVVLWAGWLARVHTRLVIREANTLSIQIAGYAKAFERQLPFLTQQWYPNADGIISVSDGVAEDLARVAAIPRERITTIYNPVDTIRIRTLAAEQLDDPWFFPSQPPVLLAVGRLMPQKDYPTLFRALVLIRSKRPVRLIVLGEGQERTRLEKLAVQLGVAQDIRMPGYAKNPYRYMVHAAALVLSSAWEGFPNVLTEALACGCPIVSTDCPSGPAELLHQGTFGQLVDVGDHIALAEAVLSTLNAPPRGEDLKKRAEMFSIDTIADQYLQVLLSKEQGVSPQSGSPL